MTASTRVAWVRLAVCAAFAVVTLSAATSVAVALQPTCPANFHDGGPFHNSGAVVAGIPNDGSLCISDGQHLAPSGNGYIHDQVIFKDTRFKVRVEVALAGIAVAAVLLFIGLARRPRRLTSPPVASVTA
jgi:hypothetical protein